MPIVSAQNHTAMDGFEKFDQVPTWEKLSQMCYRSARYWQVKWEIDPRQAYDATPSPRVARAVDIWCLQHLAGVQKEDPPDREVKLWIVVRLIYGGSVCRTAGKSGEIPLGNVPAALRLVLITSWAQRADAQPPPPNPEEE